MYVELVIRHQCHPFSRLVFSSMSASLDVSLLQLPIFLSGIGFHGGKAKALYSRDGHLGVTLVKFASDQSGLTEAMRLAEYFEKDNHGRNGWARLQPLTLGKDDENNPDLCKFDHRTGEKKRVIYGYLGTVSDLEKVDFDFRKKITIASRLDYKPSK
ncbi:hypothetical protein KY290_037532 [Solanum tuberosum]|uniref:XS domain-containing protein n=2 Tax=Solanum tuberosum TaxID=4113 RepID=A0ABQ7TXI2_SOLTU|nr:hypothetical protein KY289_037042 [Solanum tuberosum]KAH0640252.1 hypothetical protein KY285_036838 [Solanum tuberosum]KAH0738827.1 hypothetical protein KY290_037532 [Solanum tuberosum]